MVVIETDFNAQALPNNRFNVPVDFKPSAPINELVTQASRGSGEAFGELYQNYVGRIYRYMYNQTGHSMDAEDLTEQVFIKAWEAIGRFRFNGKPFGSWLFKIAGNVAIDHYRTRRFHSDLSGAVGVTTHEGNPEESAQRMATGQILMSAIKRLTDKQQQVILMKFIGGCDNTEISATMDEKEQTIRALQYRALLAMQRILSDERYGLVQEGDQNGNGHHGKTGHRYSY